MEDRFILGRLSAVFRGWSVRRLMIAVALVAFGIGVLWPIYLDFDSVSKGPYSSAYIQECRRLAVNARLIGRPERDIIKVLGDPTTIRVHPDSGGRAKSFCYSTSSYTGWGTFQVQCRDGVVHAVGVVGP